MNNDEYNQIFSILSQAYLSCAEVLGMLMRLHGDTDEQGKAGKCIVLEFPKKKSVSSKREE